MLVYAMVILFRKHDLPVCCVEALVSV